MSMLRWLRKITLLASCLGVFCTAPASGSPAGMPAAALQCALPPGSYAIVNSRGEVIGVLIVYPDCRTEIRKTVLA